MTKQEISEHIEQVTQNSGLGLSKIIHTSGISRSMLWNIRKGRDPANWEHALRLNSVSQKYKPKKIYPHLFNVLDELGLVIVRKSDGKPIVYD